MTDVLGRTKLDIDSHMAEHAVHMHRTSLYRAQCASALLADFLASHKTGTSSESVAFDKKTENECESATEVEKNTLSLPCTAIYAILCDLKGQEWKQLQRNSAQAPTATSVAHTNTPAGISTNSMENAAKKRRTSVTVGEVKFPMSLQRKLDALQAQQNNVEMALESERAADFARQSAENKALLEGFDWAFLLDLATFEGPAAVVAV